MTTDHASPPSAAGDSSEWVLQGYRATLVWDSVTGRCLNPRASRDSCQRHARHCGGSSRSLERVPTLRAEPPRERRSSPLPRS